MLRARLPPLPICGITVPAVAISERPRRAWVSWSSGKDSTMALAEIRRSETVEVVGLLVTINADADRVAMHAVRRSLVQAQAERLGLPLHTVEIPSPCPNATYESRMADVLQVAVDQGIQHVIFGDLFLADIRAYREARLADTGIGPLFPLWRRPTAQLARDQIASGSKAVLTCVDPRQLSGSFAGRTFDTELLDELPPSVDPCGENGEFHTFVWDGPGFRAPIDVVVGEVVTRGGFVFADVLPARSSG